MSYQATMCQTGRKATGVKHTFEELSFVRGFCWMEIPWLDLYLIPAVFSGFNSLVMAKHLIANKCCWNNKNNYDNGSIKFSTSVIIALFAIFLIF